MERAIAFLNASSETLVGTIHVPETSNGAGIAVGHCFTCSRHTRILTELCRRLAEAGFIALRFDFSGNGQSEGDFVKTSYSKHVGEMNAAIARLGNEGATWIGIAGHSMGGAIALITAARNPEVKAVCTMAGRYTGVNVREFLDDLQRQELLDTGRIKLTSRGRNLELGAGFFDDAAQYDLAKIAGGLKMPVLAVHGNSDEIIPVDEAVQAARINPGHIENMIVEGADHMFSEALHRRFAAESIAQWFVKQMK